jgi:hypothetical protein
LKAFIENVGIYLKCQQTLEDLENALGPEKISELVADSATRDRSQYRPESIKEPSRKEVIQCIQEEESGQGSDLDLEESGGTPSSRLTVTIGINTGLDLEEKQ